MAGIRLKVDSTGRICSPLELREQIGDTATITKTPKGFEIMPGRPVDFLDEFRKEISAEPKRKAKPKLASPEQMKSLWRTKV